jgi:hypothetical protein
MQLKEFAAQRGQISQMYIRVQKSMYFEGQQIDKKAKKINSKKDN